MQQTIAIAIHFMDFCHESAHYGLLLVLQILQSPFRHPPLPSPRSRTGVGLSLRLMEEAVLMLSLATAEGAADHWRCNDRFPFLKRKRVFFLLLGCISWPKCCCCCLYETHCSIAVFVASNDKMKMEMKIYHRLWQMFSHLAISHVSFRTNIQSVSSSLLLLLSLFT